MTTDRKRAGARLALTALAGALATAGCSPGEPVDPTPPGLVSITSLDLSTPRDTIFVSDTVRLVAQARDGQGNVLGGRAVSWSSQPSSVATVTPDGLVRALAPGSVIVTAAVTGRTASVTLVVRRLVFAVNVVPDAVCLRRGFTTLLALQAFDSLGQPLPRGFRPVTWRTSDGTIATVTPQPGDSALVLGVSAGQVLVSGTMAGVADTTGFVIDPTPLGQPLVCGGQ